MPEIGDIPAATGLLGNDGGAGFGGGPVVTGVKFAPGKYNFIYLQIPSKDRADRHNTTVQQQSQSNCTKRKTIQIKLQLFGKLSN